MLLSEEQQLLKKQHSNRRRLMLTIGVLFSLVFCFSPQYIFTPDEGILAVRTYVSLPLHVIMTQTEIGTDCITSRITIWLWPLMLAEIAYLLSFCIGTFAKRRHNRKIALNFAMIMALLFYLIGGAYVIVFNGRLYATAVPSWPFLLPAGMFYTAYQARHGRPLIISQLPFLKRRTE